MRIFMLGWEFPPFVSGGLGTACAGITKALRQLGHETLFVLPRPVGDATSPHVELLCPAALRKSADRVRQIAASAGADDNDEPIGTEAVPFATDAEKTGVIGAGGSTTAVPVPADFSGPYTGLPVAGGDQVAAAIAMLAKAGELGGLKLLAQSEGIEGLSGRSARALVEVMDRIVSGVDHPPADKKSGHYSADMFGDADRYAGLVSALGLQHQFDVIHAHDWLTYRAGLALKALTGKPLVAHVHATEFDRSGEHINQQVYDIERAGMHGADRVIAVSKLTKTICERRYGVDPHKIDVVYNGVEQDEAQPTEEDLIKSHDKIVLFLGRITMQKGPEYFVRAAKRVLEKVPHVKFVVAGSGDMAVRMIEEASNLGIGHRVLFTGFLHGGDVDRVFRMADCFVMPSVSEPFGIAPLEAMRNDVPVIVSKQSGVSEVLTHALKVDFWDVDEMANMIVAVLKYPPLGQTLRQHGAFELRGITWEGAAHKYVASYGLAIAQTAHAAAHT